MIRLDTTTRKLQIQLSGAINTNQLPVNVSYSDKTTTTYNGATQVSNTNSGSVVDICAAPAAATIRDIDYISVYNADTVGAMVTIIYNDNGTTYSLISLALSSGDQLHYVHGTGWEVTDNTGRLKTSAAPSSGYTTMQEEGSSLTQRNILNFVGGGFTASDDAGNSRTNLTLDATLNALAAFNTNGGLFQTAADTFAGRTLTGTSNRITVTNGDGVSGAPTFDISASYVGQSSITTLGTITTGTWTGTSIAAANGGTGISSYAVGDIIYASASTTLSKLADVATGNALISGGVTTAPSWGKIGLTTHISGTLAVGNGGTGITTTPTNGQIPIGNGTNYTAATITAGTNITVTNASGAITIASLSNPAPNVLTADTTVTTDTSYIVISYFNTSTFTFTVNGNFAIIY